MSFNDPILSLHLQNRTAVRSAILGPLHVGYDYRADEYAFRSVQKLITGRIATVAHSAGTLLYSVPLMHVSSSDRSLLRSWHGEQDPVQLVFNLVLQPSSAMGVYKHNAVWADPGAPLPVPYMPNHGRWDGLLLLRGEGPGYPSTDPEAFFTLDSTDYGRLNLNRLG